MANGPGHHCKYIFCHDVTCTTDAEEPAVKRVKNNYRGNLRDTVFSDPEFITIAPAGTEGLGSHSLRKFASTWAHQNGVTYLKIETPGRWKSNSHQIVA
jgi:hypothetical protein